MAAKCPKCHFENPDDTFYCGKCATRLKVSEDITVTQTETVAIIKEELTTGSTFARRYKIIEELGKGGMGKVYKALDIEINEKIALKFIRPEIAADEKTIDRFRNELRLTRKIRHKNICQMYDLNKDEGNYYITMEYVVGEDLKTMVRMSKQLSVATTIDIAKQVCEGLAEAHQMGVVHRDLKPSNIMIDREGTARIMDFGTARSIKSKGITETGVMIGTPEYMSPEQVEAKEVDNRSDIYSLGIILYEMLTGKVPFEADTPLSLALKHKSEMPKDPREHNAQIPEELSRLILRCMEKDKEKRYQNAEELLFGLSKMEKVAADEKWVAPQRKPGFRSLLIKLKERKIFETLAAFVGGGVVLIEFTHHIIVNHYHFPHQSVDIIIITLICALLSILTWRWFKGVERPRKIKVEFILIPLVILFGAFFDVSLILQIKEQALVGYRETRTISPIQYKNSIAVLPVEDLSPKRDKEALCAAMHDDIITKIRLLIPDLWVMPKQAVSRYTSIGQDPIDICREFQVETILESSLQIEKDNLRMNVRLIDVDDGSLLWSYPYQEKSEGFFRIQNEICHDIATKLKVHLKEEQIQNVQTREPKDFKAKEYYALGNYFERKYDYSRNDKDFEDGVRYFEEALSVDPNFALAYWGLGNIYQSRFTKDENWRDYELMNKNYELAYSLNPDLAEANIGLGWAYFFKEDIDNSYNFFKRAFKTDPQNPIINFDLGSFLRSIGLYRLAIDYYTRAIQLDPLFIDSYDLLSDCYIRSGEFEKVKDCIQKALDIEEANYWLYLLYAEALIMTNEYDEAEEKINQAEKLNAESPHIKTYRALIHAAKGEKEKALTLIEGKQHYLYEITSIYSLLGMKDKAIENIRKGIEIGFQVTQEYLYTYLVLKNNPFYERLHDDPLFKEIIKKEKKKYQERQKNYGRF